MAKGVSGKYDVVIVGAGIGGLVCGCYLAKSGAKVLIVEKHDKPGGYCTSFTRRGYTFDTGVHYLGACRGAGETGRIFSELSISQDLGLVRIDPSDKIMVPGKTVFVRKDPKGTVESFKDAFSEESRGIESLFDTIQSRNFFSLYSKIRRLTFEDLLDRYVVSPVLKAALSVPLGNIGLPPSRVSALTAVTMYREFILDPGYYPIGGMQAFPNILAKKMQEYGGEIVYLNKVTSILVKNNRAVGVTIDDMHEIAADVVVSNVDAFETFGRLISAKEKSVLKRIDSMDVSASAFALYLGLNLNLEVVLPDLCSTWYFTTVDVEKCYAHTEQMVKDCSVDYLLCTFPSLHCEYLAPKGKSVMSLFVLAPYLTREFWEGHKKRLSEAMIKKAEAIVPGLSGHIDVSVMATPHTFQRYTANTRGALYGWASTPQQVGKEVFPQKTCIDNLYLAGHWCTHGLGQGGVSVVAFSGRNAAKIILRERSKKSSLVMKGI